MNFAGTNLNNAAIYVGSCRLDDHSSLDRVGLGTMGMNILCDSDIGIVESMGIIDVDCGDNAIGRYVYFAPQQSSTLLNMCEIQVYGDDGKFAMPNTSSGLKDYASLSDQD